jgi:hypothetical protein
MSAQQMVTRRLKSPAGLTPVQTTWSRRWRGRSSANWRASRPGGCKIEPSKWHHGWLMMINGDWWWLMIDDWWLGGIGRNYHMFIFLWWLMMMTGRDCYMFKPAVQVEEGQDLWSPSRHPNISLGNALEWMACLIFCEAVETSWLVK